MAETFVCFSVSRDFASRAILDKSFTLLPSTQISRGIVIGGQFGAGVVKVLKVTGGGDEAVRPSPHMWATDISGRRERERERD